MGGAGVHVREILAAHSWNSPRRLKHKILARNTTPPAVETIARFSEGEAWGEGGGRQVPIRLF